MKACQPVLRRLRIQYRSVYYCSDQNRDAFVNFHHFENSLLVQLPLVSQRRLSRN